MARKRREWMDGEVEQMIESELAWIQTLNSCLSLVKSIDAGRVYGPAYKVNEYCSDFRMGGWHKVTDNGWLCFANELSVRIGKRAARRIIESLDKLA